MKQLSEQQARVAYADWEIVYREDVYGRLRWRGSPALSSNGIAGSIGGLDSSLFYPGR